MSISSPDPTCTVNATVTINGVDVTAGATITIALADTGGVKQWTITCQSTDDALDAATITAGLTIDNVAKTATFTAPNASSALVFKSIVNRGKDSNGVANPSLSTTFGIYVLTPAGMRLGAFDETLEGNAAFGWIKKFNDLARFAGVIVPAAFGGAPPPIGTASSAGAATTASRSDHDHGNAAPTATPATLCLRDDTGNGFFVGLICTGISSPASASFSITQAGNTTGDGSIAGWTGQNAKVGAYTGGGIQIAGGERGDSEHWRGDVIIYLGLEDDNDGRTAYSSWSNADGVFMRASSQSGQPFLESVGAMTDLGLSSQRSIRLSYGTSTIIGPYTFTDVAPTISGSRASGAALVSVIAALVSIGFHDTTTI